MSTHYEARLRRTGRWWAVDIPELAIHTQCRTLDEAEDMARDAIVEALDVRPETVDLELVVPEVAALLESVLAARRQRAAAEAAEQQALADAARTLSEDLRVSQGMPAGCSVCLSRRCPSSAGPPAAPPTHAHGSSAHPTAAVRRARGSAGRHHRPDRAGRLRMMPDRCRVGA